MHATDPLWYKDAIIYEVHVRAFHDNGAEGIGNFRGLTRKLDYLSDLGVTAVWLLPFYPSPLKDDGYDIADYADVHPQYGRLSDFREFLNEAHRRNIRVITELVINHTSDQHPWFQRARRSPPGSSERDFYVWSNTAEKYKEARIIFKDFEPSNWTWDPMAKAYYWHRFYSHQPDLNYDNPAVWQAILPLVDYWFGMGVDGMRLDAVPYLFERDGTNCENLPETHGFLKALRQHVDERYPNRMFLAEANQWPEDAVAYYGNGDECQMAFHFPLMPRLFMALHQEDRFPILDILAQTPAIPENCQWCLFLRNHDELTLEMVTDEERDYMYRAYAQDQHARINLGIRHRLAPLLKNDRRRVELMNALLFSMPGTPVVYYGDEIGMGDNIYLGDRNGVRTPMQWSGDRNAGFSRANPQKLYLPVIIDPEYHFEAVNVETQQNNPSSLLWWMKRLIALRKRFKAFGRGTIEFLKPSNPKVLAFVRRYQDERVLVVANLSRFVQFTDIDLREFRGLTPEELFGRSLFPMIGDQPYALSLGAHNFFWFSLEARPDQHVDISVDQPVVADIPTVSDDMSWADLLHEENREVLDALLPDYLQRQKVFERDELAASRVRDVVRFELKGVTFWRLTVRVERVDGLAETITVRLTWVAEDRIDRLLAPFATIGLARFTGATPGIVCEALAVPDCCEAILKAVSSDRELMPEESELRAVPLPGLAALVEPRDGEGPPILRHGYRGNLSVRFGERLILKTFRRIEEGMNPALEIGRFLAERQFLGAAPIVGFVEHRRRTGEPNTLLVLHQYVPNQGDAWQHTLDQLSSYFERVAALSREHLPRPPELVPLIGPDGLGERASEGMELIGGYLESARLIGQRTAELHRALASDRADLAFAPEPFGRLYQRSIYQSMRNLSGRIFGRFDRLQDQLPSPAQQMVRRLLDLRSAVLERFRSAIAVPMGGCRIRCHGNYHLERLLHTGKDFTITHFDGDPARTLGERRIKRSPLRDVAGMARSFDYAAHCVLLGLASNRGRAPGIIRAEDRRALSPWAAFWSNRVSREFVRSYLEHAEAEQLLPAMDQCRSLLDVFLLEQAMTEVEFESLHRPEWLRIPLSGVLRLMGCDPSLPEMVG